MVDKVQPLTISVITVCRNSEQTIAATVESVLWQDYPHVEYVVVDGLSTDNTWHILQHYGDRISVLLHEADSGIYNAMNKGLRLSHGEVIVFMNAGDYFVSPLVLSRVANVFERERDLDIVYGDFIADGDAGQRAYRQVERIGRRHFYLQGNLLHQSMFCRRRAFERVGQFDESLKITADRDWNIRALIVSRLRYRHVPLVICVFDQHGVSNTQSGRSLAEIGTIMARYFTPAERLQWLAWRRWVSLRDRTRYRLAYRDFRPPHIVRRWLGQGD